MLISRQFMERAVAAICVAALACSSAGCGTEKQQTAPEFSNAKIVADMATLKCFYHNTAKLSHKGSWFFNQGYKRMWVEYSGIVKYGIDADKVEITPNVQARQVVISIPPAHVLGVPDVDERSFSEPLRSTGFATSVTAEEKTEMFDKAQREMLKQAENDTVLIAQAESRAKAILEQYVRNVLGDEQDDWAVKFKEAK